MGAPAGSRKPTENIARGVVVVTGVVRVAFHISAVAYTPVPAVAYTRTVVSTTPRVLVCTLITVGFRAVPELY
jgi:hypothetical protein